MSANPRKPSVIVVRRYRASVVNEIAFSWSTVDHYRLKRAR